MTLSAQIRSTDAARAELEELRSIGAAAAKRIGISLIVVFWLLAYTSCTAIGMLPGSETQLQSATDAIFHVGDVWEYQTRPGEDQSTFTVVKIEKSAKLGVIVHIGVDHLIWHRCDGAPLLEAVPHMPFSRSALMSSAVRRVGISRSLPNYEEGYEIWRKAFLAGKAGIYTIPVKDAVSIAEHTWRNGLGCSEP